MGGKHKPKTNEKDEGVSTYFDVPGIDGSDILYFIAKFPLRDSARHAYFNPTTNPAHPKIM